MILLIAANRLVTGFPSELSQVAARTLLKKLIKISFYPAVAEYDGKQVLRDGEVIPAYTFIWAPGVQVKNLLNLLEF